MLSFLAADTETSCLFMRFSSKQKWLEIASIIQQEYDFNFPTSKFFVYKIKESKLLLQKLNYSANG